MSAANSILIKIKYVTIPKANITALLTLKSNGNGTAIRDDRGDIRCKTNSFKAEISKFHNIP